MMEIKTKLPSQDYKIEKNANGKYKASFFIIDRGWQSLGSTCNSFQEAMDKAWLYFNDNHWNIVSE